jgi:hypothetical protein
MLTKCRRPDQKRAFSREISPRRERVATDGNIDWVITNHPDWHLFGYQIFKFPCPPLKKQRIYTSFELIIKQLVTMSD